MSILIKYMNAKGTFLGLNVPAVCCLFWHGCCKNFHKEYTCASSLIAPPKSFLCPHSSHLRSISGTKTSSSGAQRPNFGLIAILIFWMHFLHQKLYVIEHWALPSHFETILAHYFSTPPISFLFPVLLLLAILTLQLPHTCIPPYIKSLWPSLTQQNVRKGK